MDKTNYDNKSSESENQLSTAVLKVQIKLNNLIINHKDAIKLYEYDDIVELFNNYISSPTFDPYAKLKTRKSFIKSMEASYLLSPLCPRNTEVWLHDGGRVTVPVIDAKAMILDLLTNPNLMNTTNMPKITTPLLAMLIIKICQTKSMERFTLEMSGSLLKIGFVLLRI